MSRRILLLLTVVSFTCGRAQAQSASQPAKGVSWLSFEQSLEQADQRDRPVLIDIYAPWCGWCSRLQSEVYTDARVQDYLEEWFSVGRLNIDSVDDVVNFRGYELTSAELAMGLGASGTPTTVFLDSSGDYITRLPGFVGPDEFLQILKFIGTGAYKSASFESFVQSR